MFRRILSLLLVFLLMTSTCQEALAGTLILPNALSTVEDEAFEGDSSLDEVVLPDGIDRIESRAFANSTVREINLPESLSYIADDAFEGSSPEITATNGSYAHRWAAGHELITTLAFNDISAYDYTTTRAVFSENSEIGLYHESWIRSYQLANYDALTEAYGEEPVWNIEPIGEFYGATLRYEIGEWAGDGARAIEVFIENEPEFPCTLSYTVSCSWGGETIIGNGTLEYQETTLPTGLNTPDELRGLKVGENYAFCPQVTPEGYGFGDSEYCDLWTDMDCDNWDEWEDGECVRYIRPHEAGVFQAWLVKRYNNIQMRKIVRLYVANESEIVPAAAPKLDEGYWFDMAISVENGNGYDVYIDNRTLGISFSNLQLLRELCGDDCSWSFETIEGPKLELSGTMYEDYFDFTVDNLEEISENSQSLVKATLTWGGTSAETLFHMNFGYLRLPDQIIFERNIRTTVGEAYRATVSIEPDGDSLKHFLYYDALDADALEKWEGEDQDSFYLKANQAGYFAVRPHIHAADNVFIMGPWDVLTVFNKNGSIPEPVPFFLLEEGDSYETGFILGEFATSDGEGWFSDRHIFGWVLDNLPQLYEAYGEDPEIVWSWEHTGGIDVEIELEPQRIDRYVGDGCGVMFAEMPTQAGITEFNLYCDWNGHRGTLPCRIYLKDKPANLPQTNTFPDEITVGVGETVYVSGHYPEGSYDVGENYYWIDADDAHVGIERNQDEQGSLTITGIQKGTITAQAKVGVSGNAFVQKLVTIHIVQDEDRILDQLEEALEQMDESEAFTLLNEEWIDLPAIDSLGREYADYVELFNEEQTQYLSYARQYNEAITQARESFNALCAISEAYTLTETDSYLSMDNDGLQLNISSDALELIGQGYEVESVDIAEDGCVMASLRNNSGQPYFISIQDEQINIGLNPSLESSALRSNGTTAVKTGGVAQRTAPRVPDFWDNLANRISLSDDIVSLSEDVVSNITKSMTDKLFNWNANEIAKQNDHLKWLDNWEKQINDTEALKLLQDARAQAQRKIDLRKNGQNILEKGGKWFRALSEWLPLVGSVADIESIYQARVKMLELDNLKKHGHPTEFERDEETRNLIDRMNSSIDFAQQDYWATITINTVSALLGVAPLRTIKGAGKTCQRIANFMNDLKLTDKTIAGLDIASMITDSFNADRLYSYAFELDECLHFELGGMVQDANTGKPVEGAEVTCLMNNYAPMTTRTDKEGVFYFEPLTPTVEIVVEKENYKTTDPIPLPSVGILQRDTRSFEVIKLEEKPGILSGEVRAESDLRPLEGAVITVGDVPVTSDANGKYYMELPEGIYTITCVRAGYLQASMELVELKKGETTVVRPFLLEKGHEIWNRADLEAVADNLSETYVVCANISLSDAPWTPLPWFSGTLDGCGFTISGMNIEGGVDGNAGLFAGLSGALIKNLNISGASVDVAVDSSFTNTGLLCGNMVQGAEVRDSVFTGTIRVSDGSVSGGVFTGGISGLANYGSFYDCQSNVNIEVNYKNNMNIGGVFGQMHSGSISQCAYNGTLRANQSGSNPNAQILVDGIGYSGSIQALNSSVSGYISATGIDGEVLAFGLTTSYHGENRASVSASSDRGRAYAVGAQECQGVITYGSVSARSLYKNADAAGLNSCTLSINKGSISASSAYGDCTAIGIVGIYGTNITEGSTYASSLYGNPYHGDYPYGVGNNS